VLAIVLVLLGAAGAAQEVSPGLKLAGLQAKHAKLAANVKRLVFKLGHVRTTHALLRYKVRHAKHVTKYEARKAWKALKAARRATAKAHNKVKAAKAAKKLNDKQREQLARGRRKLWHDELRREMERPDLLAARMKKQKAYIQSKIKALKKVSSAHQKQLDDAPKLWALPKNKAQRLVARIGGMAVKERRQTAVLATKLSQDEAIVRRKLRAARQEAQENKLNEEILAQKLAQLEMMNGGSSIVRPLQHHLKKIKDAAVTGVDREVKKVRASLKATQASVAAAEAAPHGEARAEEEIAQVVAEKAPPDSYAV